MSEISEPVRRFLADEIDSLEQLEVLLLVRASAQRAFSVDEVSRALGSSHVSIERRLDDLANRQLVVKRQAEANCQFQYAPSTDALRATVDLVAEAYRVRRLAVIDVIYGAPRSPIRSFSEAFKLTKKNEP